MGTSSKNKARSHSRVAALHRGYVTSDFMRDILAGRIRRGMRFHERVWAVTARIPSGRVATYGDIAHRLGTHAYRAVGQALHANPYSPEVPCHRVVGRDGQLTGFAGGLKKKVAMLAAEGVELVQNKVDLDQYRHKL